VFGIARFLVPFILGSNHYLWQGGMGEFRGECKMFNQEKGGNVKFISEQNKGGT